MGTFAVVTAGDGKTPVGMARAASRIEWLTDLRRAVISSRSVSTVASVFWIVPTSERSSFIVASIRGFQVSNTLAAPSSDSTWELIEDSTVTMRLVRLV
jgi:hypothetical protein